MESKKSRRQFLQAGLALPAAGPVSSNAFESAIQSNASAPKFVYRALGKTGLKISWHKTGPSHLIIRKRVGWPRFVNLEFRIITTLCRGLSKFCPE
jgi:hypothetical protein